MLLSGSMNKISTVPKPVSPRRRRFQRGSLQKRKSGGGLNWIVFWWQDHHRRSQVLGPCSEMTRPEALAEMAKLLQPLNAHAGQVLPRVWTLTDWIRDSFLPFSRRRWKLSTASTTGDRIRKHILPDLGTLEIPSITRDLLQQYLEQKAAQGLSFSLVDHLRWDLRFPHLLPPRLCWLALGSTLPPGRHSCRSGHTARETALSYSAWHTHIACVGVVALYHWGCWA